MLDMPEYLGLEKRTCEDIAMMVIEQFAYSIVTHEASDGTNQIEIPIDHVFKRIYECKYDMVVKKEFALICFGMFYHSMTKNDKEFFNDLRIAIRSIKNKKNGG